MGRAWGEFSGVGFSRRFVSRANFTLQLQLPTLHVRSRSTAKQILRGGPIPRIHLYRRLNQGILQALDNRNSIWCSQATVTDPQDRIEKTQSWLTCFQTREINGRKSPGIVIVTQLVK